MATIYKRGGKQNRRGRYYISYFNHRGERVTRSARTTDRAAAERIASKLEADAALRRDGVIDPLEDRLSTEERRDLAEHLAEFKEVLLAKGNDPDYVTQSMARLQYVVREAAALRISQMTASAVQRAIGKLRTRNRGLATCNTYLRATKAFTAWLVRDRRLREDPFKSLSTFNEAIDRRHVRREPTLDEFTWLIRTTQQRTEASHKLAGPDRAMLYVLAAGTGLRSSELRSLTSASFRLDHNPPAVLVTAAYSKRRRDDLQPLPVQLANELRPWLAAKEPGKRVFHGMPNVISRTLRRDLEAARKAWIDAAETETEKESRRKSNFLAYRNAEGAVFDFHAFRHAFISAVVNSGASVKVAQELARHSTPLLTIGRYAHVRLNDLCSALEALPLPQTGPATDSPAPQAQHKAQQSGCDS